MGKLTKAQERIDTDLSDNAKAVGYAFFSTAANKVTFHLKTHGPSPECQAALDELVAKGFATVEPLNQFGGLVYRPTTSFGHLAKWAWDRAESGVSLVLWQPLGRAPLSNQEE